MHGYFLRSYLIRWKLNITINIMIKKKRKSVVKVQLVENVTVIVFTVISQVTIRQRNAWNAYISLLDFVITRKKRKVVLAIESTRLYFIIYYALESRLLVINFWCRKYRRYANILKQIINRQLLLFFNLIDIVGL